MIYEGVMWFIESVGRLFHFMLDWKIIGDISMLEISLGIFVASMIISFLKFGFESNNDWHLLSNTKSLVENAKQKKLDRYEPKHSNEYIPKHSKDYKPKHGKKRRF